MWAPSAGPVGSAVIWELSFTAVLLVVEVLSKLGLFLDLDLVGVTHQHAALFNRLAEPTAAYMGMMDFSKWVLGGLVRWPIRSIEGLSLDP